MSMDHETILVDLRTKSDEELTSECASILQVTVENLTRLSLILKVREERGHDISGIHPWMIDCLRAVASGALLPEVAVKCADRPRLLKTLSQRSPDVQKQWMRGEIEIKLGNGGPPKSVESIEIDTARECVLVTGTRVILTAERMRQILAQMDSSKPWMCSGCAETFGTSTKPVQCAKCGSHAFERACSMAV